MSETEGPGKRRPGSQEPEDVLRAKYHDYCSAQVADTLLRLSPDEMYLLAESAARESGDAGELAHSEVVRLATERITSQLDLPPFDIWVEEYLAHPERFDEHLMGFWESDPVTEPGDG